MTLTVRPKQRDISIDIAKVLAILAVVIIHFFLHTGIQGAPANNKTIWVEVFIRQSMSFCVPIFLIATGYLMHKKKLSKNHYSKLPGILFVYLAVSIIYWGFAAATGSAIDIKNILGKIIGLGEGSPYSWYVEMYIGLFLLIPFLNLIWDGLKTKKSRQILCATLIFLTTLPRIAFKNIHLPDYWLNLWPFMYYYLGAYFSAYRPKIPNGARATLLIASWGLLCAAAVYQISSNNSIVPVNLVEWNYPWITLYSIAIFISILGINPKIPKPLSKLITSISSLTLGIYLMSAIFDIAIYNKILNVGSAPVADFKLILITVPIVFIASFISAIIIKVIYTLILRVPKIIQNKRKTYNYHQ